MEIQRWDPDADGPVDEAVLRDRLREMGYRVNRYSYPPGTRFSEHTHAVDKIDAVVSGRFRVVLEGEEVILGPGDWVAVPAGAVHSAEVVGDEAVDSLDAIRI